MKKYLANIVLIIGVSMLTMWILMGSENSAELVKYLMALTPKWVAIGFGCLVMYWGLETIIQYLLVEKMYKGNGLWNAFKVVMTGHFFNAVTPFASGGQPMQAFLMVKQGVPLGTSASILLSKFIIYQLALTFYSMVVLILELKFFVIKVKGIVYLALIGFMVNLGIVVILIMAAFMKGRLQKMGFWLVNRLYKMHLIKEAYGYKKKIISQVELFNRNIGLIKQNTVLLCSISLLTILQLTAYFLIPYAVYRAFGLSGTQVFVMISAAAFIVMFASFIPVPGGSGIAEGSFFLLFQLFFPQSILPIAVFCWRVITFYIPLCLGGVMTVLPNQKKKCRQMNIGA